MNYVYAATALTGGGSGALDAIDGGSLSDNDVAIVVYNNNVYVYQLDASSSESESSPEYIAPDTSPGTKMWVLQGLYTWNTKTIFIPITSPFIADGASAPDAAAVVNSGNGYITARTFDSSADEDVMIFWPVPENADVSEGIKYRVLLVVTAATAPSSEGVAFYLAGASVGTGDSIGITLGTAVKSSKTGMSDARYDLVWTDQSDTVTVTDLAADEVALLSLYRDVSDTDDDYGQLIGVVGIELEYTVLGND